MSVMGAKNKRTTTMGPFLKKGRKKARRKMLVVLTERSKELTGKKPNYNGTFFKVVSRSNRTVKTSHSVKHNPQWGVFEKGQEKSPPKNVGRSERTVKTSHWQKRRIDNAYVLTIEGKTRNDSHWIFRLVKKTKNLVMKKKIVSV